MKLTFKEWAEKYQDQLAEHMVKELNSYEARQELYDKAIDFVKNASINDYSNEIIKALFVVLSDTYVEDNVFNEIPWDEELILFLASKVLHTNYEDVIPTFGIALSKIKERKEEAENILLEMVKNNEEYTSRMALLSLSKLKSTKTEELAKIAWQTGSQYQRIACLHALKEIESNNLEEFVKKAIEDGRLYVVQNAIEIENENT